MSPALNILMNKSHGTIFRAMKDVPILVVNCSEEFETDEKQREIMIQRVRDFLRRIEFDDSQDQDLKDQRDLSSTNQKLSHDSNSLSTEHETYNDENVDPNKIQKDFLIKKQAIKLDGPISPNPAQIQ